jgi:hypothetical protein
MNDASLLITITLLCLSPVLIAIIVPISLVIYRRQYKSIFSMDGASCVETKEGNIIIKPRNLRNVLVLLFFGLTLIGLIALLLSAIINLVKGTATIGIGGIFGLAGVIILLSLAVKELIGLLQRSSVHINGNTGFLEIGSRSSQRQIPLATISSVLVKPIKQQVIKSGGAKTDIITYFIGVMLENREEIQFGTISGNSQKSKENAINVGQLIQQTLHRQRGQYQVEAG